MDVWWVDANGQNADEVAADVTRSFLSQGMPWYQHQTNLPEVLRDALSEHDCLLKFDLVQGLARQLGNETLALHYAELVSSESVRIGVR